MIFARLFKRDPAAAAAQRLYLDAVAQARHPDFYRSLGVPDTLDGRFEMVALHVFLVVRRLRAESGSLARALSEMLFADMDRNLREMGAGDLGVGRHVQAMAEGFYGRATAYDAALAGAEPGGEGALLVQALRRNVYGTLGSGGPSAAQLGDLCGYVRTAADILERCPLARLTAAPLDWPPVAPSTNDR